MLTSKFLNKLRCVYRMFIICFAVVANKQHTLLFFYVERLASVYANHMLNFLATFESSSMLLCFKIQECIHSGRVLSLWKPSYFQQNQ